MRDRDCEKAEAKAKFNEKYALSLSEMNQREFFGEIDRDEFYRLKYEFEQILCAWAEGVLTQMSSGR